MSARNSPWQIGSELHRPDVSTGDFTTWSIATSNLTLDRNARMTNSNPVIPEVSRDLHETSRLPFLEIRNSQRLAGKAFHGDDGWNLGWGIGEYLNKGMFANRQHNLLQLPDKWLKTLPPAEILPRNEILGGYIFVCNNDTMQEDLKRQLFGLPQRYRDSVRAIIPGLPLFLYNYSTHQLHGVYQAVSFGGSNIDPTAWEDKKCKGESRFPAQVRIRVKKRCKALEEDSFRPILHHYDGPKFRLQLSVPEAVALLDLFMEEDK